MNTKTVSSFKNNFFQPCSMTLPYLQKIEDWSYVSVRFAVIAPYFQVKTYSCNCIYWLPKTEISQCCFKWAIIIFTFLFIKNKGSNNDLKVFGLYLLPSNPIKSIWTFKSSIWLNKEFSQLEWKILKCILRYFFYFILQ